ncbi:MAG: hypothetical protein AAF519_00935 [Bacteroidota bacterium]
MSKRIFQFSLLLAILAIPVLIFLFLKTFGKNQFSIPYYHTQGVRLPFSGCDYPKDTFHVHLSSQNSKRANVTLFFGQDAEFTSSDLENVRTRLKALFSKDMSFVAHNHNAALDSASLKKLMNCGFVTDTVNQFILHDQKGRIRGYYNTDRKEVDRLIVEIKILLENE